MCAQFDLVNCNILGTQLFVNKKYLNRNPCDLKEKVNKSINLLHKSFLSLLSDNALYSPNDDNNRV
jgi:hypothetical protein